MSPSLPSLYAEVVLDDAPAVAGGAWTYAVPEDIAPRLEVGRRVEVPFGGRVMEGTVVRFPAGFAEEGPTRIRPLRRVLDDRPLLPAPLVVLALRASEVYLSPPAALLRAAFPPAGRVSEEVWVRLLLPREEVLSRMGRLRSRRGQEVLQLLLSKPRWDGDELAEAWEEASGRRSGAGALASVLQLLEREGLVLVERRRKPQATCSSVSGALPAAGAGAVPRVGPAAVAVAAPAAIAAVAAASRTATPPLAGGPGGKPLLLWGGDPYGRAEVYIQLIGQVLARGQGALVLVPEAEQAEMLAAWWRQPLGSQLAVLHSRLPPARRQRAWFQLYEGEAHVALGPRSAVFAPVPELGLIIVEQEEDSSYKQQENPRYDARTVARLRAADGAELVLGSATPRVETFYLAEKQEMLTRRLVSPPPPRVTLVDLRASRVRRRQTLSPELRARIRECVAAGKRVVLFLNRRGYAGTVACRECGEAIPCPRCRVSLVYHFPSRLHCHLCGFTRPVPDVCPFCGGRDLGTWGAGTQKTEEEVNQLLQGVPVFRLDTDAAAGGRRERQIWEAFLSKTPAVLVGTQMLLGTREIPDLGLVGVVNADLGLHLPDFRAGERVFGLLYQLGEMVVDWGGELLIQTHRPEHHVLRAAVAHDYRQFYELELQARQELCYPPFSHLVRVVCASAGEDRARAAAEAIAAATEAVRAPGLEVLGPAPAPLSPYRGVHRWAALWKGIDAEVTRRAVEESLRKAGPANTGLRLTVDVDPQDML